MQQDPKKGNSFSNYAKYSAIAFQMFAIIGIGSFIGVKLDDYYENEKMWTIIFSLGSTILAVVFVIRRIIANSNDDN